MLNHSSARRTHAVVIAATAALLASPAIASADTPDTVISTSTVISTDAGTHIDIQTDELLDVCPVDGTATFEDSWGWARSGGRSHEGVDMIAERGTPVVAVRDGDAIFKQNRLGGNAVWLTTSNGDRFYYAHLGSFAGDSGPVHAGDVIGYVGSTGNAHGPHLHFETLPNGSVENPYPHTLAACVPTSEELEAIAAHRANALNDPAVWERFVPAS